ncbi:MAG: hypothetical protein MHM6MM_003598 [Cercozoa sp. M6MM]
MSEKPELILGSSSIFRQRFMKDWGLPHTIATADIDEYSIVPHGVSLEKRARCDPHSLTTAIACAKADAIMQKLSSEGQGVPRNALLICSDQVSVYKGEIREKPSSEQQCRQWLHEYSEAPVYAVTAIVVVDLRTGQRFVETGVGEELFRPFTEQALSQLFEQGEVLLCAGGFINNEISAPFVERRLPELSYLVGFPRAVLTSLLTRAGYQTPQCQDN